MAISFDLEISFLREKYDFNAFVGALHQQVTPYKEIDFHRIYKTFVTVKGSDPSQLSLTPQNISFGHSKDIDSNIHHEVSDDECLALSLHMYEFIKELPDYQLAIVGWELGYLSNFLKFNKDGDIINIAEVEGLVVSNKLLSSTKTSNAWQVFDSNHHWIPCESAIGNIFDDDDEN